MTFLATAEATKQRPIFKLEMRSTDQDRFGRNCSAFEDLLLLLTSAFSPFFPLDT